MTTLTPELMDQIRKLSPADKALVQEELAHEVEPLSDEWKVEIRRRVESHLSGESVALDMNEFLSNLEARFAGKD
jgi:Putative addiction module component